MLSETSDTSTSDDHMKPVQEEKEEWTCIITCNRAEFVSTHKKSSGDLQKYLGGIIKIPVGLE